MKKCLFRSADNVSSKSATTTEQVPASQPAPQVSVLFLYVTWTKGHVTEI